MTRRRLAPLLTLATATALLVPVASAAAAPLVEPAPAATAPAADVATPVNDAVTNRITWQLFRDNRAYAAYVTMLGQLRAAATQERIGNPGVPMTYPVNNDGIIAVNISSMDGHRVTLYYTRANLYLRGFGVTGSNQVFQFSDYNLTGQINATQITTLAFDGNYTGDHSLGSTSQVDRSTLRYSTDFLSADIETLATYNPSAGNNAAAATSLIRLIGATAEAARQIPLANTVSAGLRSGGAATLTTNEVTLENRWSRVSNWANETAHGQHPAAVTYGGVTFNSLNAVASVFALLLRPGAGGTHQ
ncbi:ribosome-inactivating family protein [Kitasatospora sp. NPDC088134]|uniref:ribosome-inactivating family protein n=1 Tax=Kitasatospora sp. NPDC088134 TaxID=3364071 RepID=UPI003809D94A